MLRFIALRLQVVKALLSEDRWFETVKYTSALTKLLSYFFEVNCAKKVKADKEVTRRNTRTLSLSKYQIQGTCTEKEKVHYNNVKGESIKVVDEGESISLQREQPSHPPPRC